MPIAKTNKILIINYSLLIILNITGKYIGELVYLPSVYKNTITYTIGLFILIRSIIGVRVGIEELKTKGKLVLIGIIGNSILILLLLITVVYGIRYVLNQ